jgi:hypothetical protein
MLYIIQKSSTAVRFNSFQYKQSQHMFQSRNLLALNVVAGKTYYVHANDAMGLEMATRLDPVRNGGKGKYQYSSEWIQSCLDKTVLAKTHPKLMEYSGKERFLKAANKSREKLLKEWEAWTENERQAFTLNLEDGIPAKYYSSQTTHPQG